jgi:hypothetical protein
MYEFTHTRCLIQNINYNKNFQAANPSPPERWTTKQHTECDNEQIGPYVNYKKKQTELQARNSGTCADPIITLVSKNFQNIFFLLFLFSFFSSYIEVPRIFCRSLGLHSLPFLIGIWLEKDWRQSSMAKHSKIRYMHGQQIFQHSALCYTLVLYLHFCATYSKSRKQTLNLSFIANV